MFLNRAVIYNLSFQTFLLLLAFAGLSIGVQHPVSAQSTNNGKDVQGNSEEVKVVTKRVEYLSDGLELSTIGEALKEYGDGSMLLLAPDGRLLSIQGEDIKSSVAVTEAMVPASSEEIFEAIKAQLPQGFQVHKTKHYLLVYNTSDAYVQWVGHLFERLYRGFNNYWRTRGIDLEEPRFPLVAVVFSDKASYLAYGERDIGSSASAMIGYYNMNTNRMAMYDLTGVDVAISDRSRISSQAVVNQILSRPQAERTVATIVHEAVHQLAFNTGLQTRLADNPLWLCEGMAMFFEAPDLRSAQGWKIGNVNYHNFRLFAQRISNRPTDSLTTLITDDSLFQDAKTAAQAYPESWALTYFLMNTHAKEFSDYVAELSLLEPLGETDPRKRLDVFKKHFGELDALDKAFLLYMRRLR